MYCDAPAVDPEKIVPTIGLNVAHVRTAVGARPCTVRFWDLGGQTDLQTIWRSYYGEAHGIVFVVDSTDGMRLAQVLESFAGVIADGSVEGVPVLVLANKQDAADALAVHEIKQLFNPLAEQLDARDSTVLPVSALRG